MLAIRLSTSNVLVPLKVLELPRLTAVLQSLYATPSPKQGPVFRRLDTRNGSGLQSELGGFATLVTGSTNQQVNSDMCYIG